jgi:hypothetical protein
MDTWGKRSKGKKHANHTNSQIILNSLFHTKLRFGKLVEIQANTLTSEVQQIHKAVDKQSEEVQQIKMSIDDGGKEMLAIKEELEKYSKNKVY